MLQHPQANHPVDHLEPLATSLHRHAREANQHGDHPGHGGPRRKARDHPLLGRKLHKPPHNFQLELKRSSDKPKHRHKSTKIGAANSETSKCWNLCLHSKRQQGGGHHLCTFLASSRYANPTKTSGHLRDRARLNIQKQNDCPQLHFT